MGKLKISMGVIKSALDHSLSGVCIVQRQKEESSKIVYTNPSFCELVGFTRKELIGKTPDCFTTDQIHFDLEPGESSIQKSGNIRHKSDAGLDESCEVTVKFTSFSQDDESYLMGSFQDHKEMNLARRSKDELQNQHSNLFDEVEDKTTRFSALINNVSDVVWECDENFCYTFVSGNAKKILGYEPSELLGKPVYTHMAEKYQTFFKTIFPENELLLTLQRISTLFIKADGEEISLEISGNPIQSAHSDKNYLIGTSRDVTATLKLKEESKEFFEGMTIKIDEQCRLIFASPDTADYFPNDLAESSEQPDFLQFVIDQSLVPLFTFSFLQQENMPFPVEVKLTHVSGDTTHFNIDFRYNEDEQCLEGELVPANTNDQFALMSKKMEKQKESMENSVEMDPEMRQTVIEDSQGLTSDILSLIKAIEPFSFSNEDHFDLQEYSHFIEEKNIHEYRENVRLLGNKIHGLKGTSGFLIPASKRLCHHIEEITRPLAENKLVLTVSLARLLKQFIFEVQDMLETYQNENNSSFEIDDFMSKIDESLQAGLAYLGEQTGDFLTLLVKHSTEPTEVNKSRSDDYISVSQKGYDILSEQVKNLFFMVSETLVDDSLIKAGSLYNEFLDSHQKIVKVPPDLSRYERLVPSWAKEYDKEAEFIFQDQGVRADHELWSALHEIFSHSLKNAVIHGLESNEERKKVEKDSPGKVIVNIEEDALHLYVSISDDGKGIDVEKMGQKAVESQVITTNQLQMMSKEEVLNLVFVQGVSTAETLDDNAGRGVGMNAVQEAMRQFQGKCQIESKMGQGTTWNYIFPKSNVSLPCFIVTIGNFRIAIPENHVEAFYGYHDQYIKQINQKLVYRRAEEIIPLLNCNEFFDETVIVDENHIQRILIIQAGEQKMGVVINDIIHHAVMPILPLPEEYRQVPIYLGATLLGNHSVLVLNANQMFLN